MRALLASVGAAALLFAAAPAGAGAQPAPTALRALQQNLANGIGQAGPGSGAYVVDLDTGQPLFAAAPDVPRLPASVEKVYTTSTALLRYGPNATFDTAVLATGGQGPTGVWHGTLYLRGGGDPTFGSVGFDRNWYGTGTTMHTLLTSLLRANSITGLRGRVVGDESYFDSVRGTPATGLQSSTDVEGLLSALTYNRGFANPAASGFQSRPALFAAQQLVGAMRSSGLSVPARTKISVGRTPPSARLLVTVHSPRIAKLIQLTNTPSDNFLAEMLLKGLGARFAGAGATWAGAAVVRSELATRFGVLPTVVDGSGLSRADATSPRQVVTVLAGMADNQYFFNSLAIAGETGTLQDEMQGTPAQGQCHGKTGTLVDVSNLAGYCLARDGHMLAFAFLMNSINPADAHPIQNQMAVALARYDG